MKKFLTPFFLLLFSVTILSAQKSRNDLLYFAYQPDGNMAAKQQVVMDYKKNGVKATSSKRFNKKSNTYKVGYISYYNPYGVFSGYQTLDKKGEVRYANMYHYIDSIHYDKVYLIHKKDTSMTVSYQYDNRMNMIGINSTWGKNKSGLRTVYTYNDHNHLVKTENFYRTRKNYTYEYDYYDNGSRKETREYNRGGKLKHVWNYACSPAGDLYKNVAQTSFCKSHQADADGTYYEIFEGTDNKGKMRRLTNKYSKDSLLLETKEFNTNGKETYRRAYTYDGKKNYNTITTYEKGNLEDTYYYTYNDKGLMTATRVTNGKGKEIANNVYDYQYY